VFGRPKWFERRRHHAWNIRHRGGSVGNELFQPWGVPSVLITNTTNATTNEVTTATTTTIDNTNTTSPSTLIPTSNQPQWKASLPDALRNKNPQSLQKLCMFGCIDIYLLGTAHVSNDSSADVQQLLSHIEPDCIFLELCDARMSLLHGNNNKNKNDHQTFTNITSISDTCIPSNTTIPPRVTWRDRLFQWNKRNVTPITNHVDHHLPRGTNGDNWFQTMSTVLLTTVQEDYAAQLGVELGGEFRCAYQYWYDRQQRQRQREQRQEHSEALDVTTTYTKPQPTRPHLILGDRPVQITLIRAWESLSWWGRIKVCIGLIWSALPLGKPKTEELRAWLVSVMQNDGSDLLSQSLDELRQSFPTLHTTIIAERDAWLAAKLIQTSYALQQQLQQQQQQYIDPDHQIRPRQRRSIVAVVGAGHVPGIVQWLTVPPTTTTTNTTVEHVLAELVTTKRWANNVVVQQEWIPSWIMDVVEVNYEMTVQQ
jgi:pheromone shutdown protein TraB